MNSFKLHILEGWSDNVFWGGCGSHDLPTVDIAAYKTKDMIEKWLVVWASLEWSASLCVDRYVDTNRRLPEFLNRLKSNNKRLFLITNSPYWFV